MLGSGAWAVGPVGRAYAGVLSFVFSGRTVLPVARHLRSRDVADGRGHGQPCKVGLQRRAAVHRVAGREPRGQHREPHLPRHRGEDRQRPWQPRHLHHPGCPPGTAATFTVLWYLHVSQWRRAGKDAEQATHANTSMLTTLLRFARTCWAVSVCVTLRVDLCMKPCRVGCLMVGCTLFVCVPVCDVDLDRREWIWFDLCPNFFVCVLLWPGPAVTAVLWRGHARLDDSSLPERVAALPADRRPGVQRVPRDRVPDAQGLPHAPVCVDVHR